ncbi:MAG: peptidylprolyl isomerase [Bacteroidetes bacterium]|nr:MAG: peptidylprolyl isomerase [Bacteroidota bacterium]REK05830.1 MAG: peptidylprolyl isomerase [Bacteroidota bacterium]REK31947.1 MAG: peptidylprolyl isomerase [Bacteroidota bacterium]REK50099.1 MAG: peptidylprolyl isomerase [Bacteroidota bacterium]
MIGSGLNARNKEKKRLTVPQEVKVDPAADKSDTLVMISTEYGDMIFELFKQTPLHRSNFIKLVSEGYYDSLLFHRVIRNFMIQGGDPLSKHAGPDENLGMGDVGYTIPAEFSDTIFHRKGALCAARTDNPEKASSGCQFYIVQGQVFTPEQMTMLELQRGLRLNEAQRKVYGSEGGTPWLDNNYTVFGQLTEGMNVIDSIAALETKPGDRPVRDVRMKISLLIREE